MFPLRMVEPFLTRLWGYTVPGAPQVTTDPRQELGRWGERTAEGALGAAGLRIVARRHRRRLGELDLVATDGELVVFVEVKTRRRAGDTQPADAITPAKRRRIARNALAYLAERDWLERPCRFDVVEVWRDGTERGRVRHIADAFRIWPTG